MKRKINSKKRQVLPGDFITTAPLRLQDNVVLEGKKIILETGKITVKDNYFGSTGDTRSHAKIMLDKIESILEGRADADVSSYSIQGRSLSKIGIAELLQWRDYYKAEYQKEVAEFRTGNKEGSGRVVKVQFNDVG